MPAMNNLILRMPDFDSGGSIYETLPLVPENQILFVGPLACARHELRAGDEFRRAGRISYLITQKPDLALGTYLDRICEAVGELCRTGNIRAITMLFSCQNALIGTDYNALCEDLTRQTDCPVRYLEINRLNMYAKKPMPLMMPTRCEVIYSFLQRSGSRDNAVNLIGSSLPPDRGDVLFSYLSGLGVEVRHITDFDRFDDFQRMANARLTICLSPDAATAAAGMEQSLGIPFLPLYPGYHPGTLLAQYQAIGRFFGKELTPQEDCMQCEHLLRDLATSTAGRSVVIGGERMSAPYSFARFMLEAGCNVCGIRITRKSGTEPEHQAWLREYAPDVELRRMPTRRERDLGFYCLAERETPPEPPLTQPVGFSALREALRYGAQRTEAV